MSWQTLVSVLPDALTFSSSTQVALLGVAGVGDPQATRTVYSTIVVLLLLGVVLVCLAIWVFRRTRPEPELLAPLEAMQTRGWRKLDPAAQRRLLDDARPTEAAPLRREASQPAVDSSYALIAPVSSFDDLSDGADGDGGNAGDTGRPEAGGVPEDGAPSDDVTDPVERALADLVDDPTDLGLTDLGLTEVDAAEADTDPVVADVDPNGGLPGGAPVGAAATGNSGGELPPPSLEMGDQGAIGEQTVLAEVACEAPTSTAADVDAVADEAAADKADVDEVPVVQLIDPLLRPPQPSDRRI